MRLSPLVGHENVQTFLPVQSTQSFNRVSPLYSRLQLRRGIKTPMSLWCPPPRRLHLSPHADVLHGHSSVQETALPLRSEAISWFKDSSANVFDDLFIAKNVKFCRSSFSKMRICCFFSVVSDSKLNMFVFWTVGWTIWRHHWVSSILWWDFLYYFLTFYKPNDKKN